MSNPVFIVGALICSFSMEIFRSKERKEKDTTYLFLLLQLFGHKGKICLVIFLKMHKNFLNKAKEVLIVKIVIALRRGEN